MIEHRVLLKFIMLAALCVGRGTCDYKYLLTFNEGLSDCDDFKNDILKGDNLDLGKADDGGDSMFLEGYIEISDPIKEGTMIDIEIAKETELGSEPMWGCSLDVCKSIDDPDAPWAEAVKSLNITGCPIETGQYTTQKFAIDSSSAKDFMNHEFAADYEVIIKMSDPQKNTMSCHLMGMGIKEVEAE